jgi:hypothetical protein
MSSHVQDLAAHLAALQTSSTEEVSQLKAQYEEKLRLQREESAVIQQHNSARRSHIKRLREDSTKVRKQTVGLVQISRHTVDQLNGMRDSFKEAGAVITNVLGEASEKMTSSPELEVLQELVETDSKRKQDSVDEHRFDEITKSSSQDSVDEHRFDEITNPNELALLQFDSKPAGDSQQEAQELVKSLMASLGSLTEEQNVSSASLKTDFEEEWGEGVKRQSALLSEQAELNSTDIHEQERNTKLHAALQHAHEVRTHLKERLVALRRFAKGVGNRSMPESSSKHVEHNDAKRLMSK